MNIVDLAKIYVFDLFRNKCNLKLVFHSIDHTLSVVHYTELISKEEGLSDHDFDAICIAAWFHDTGYLRQLDNHEEVSVTIAKEFLQDKEVDDSFIQIVETAILATTRKNAPSSVYEQIILDADVAHLGFPEFITISTHLKEERSLCFECKLSSDDYWRGTLDFMKNQVFYTDYAKKVLLPVKQMNITIVEEIVEKENRKKEKAEKKKKSSKDGSAPTKGIESMFRLTASNQMRLSAMADKKANILISINSIFISVSAAAVTKYHIMGERLVPSIVVLFVSSLASLIFAILSCRPKLNNTKYTETDIEQRKVNLLFFGNFYQIPYPRYNKAIKEIMKDYDYLYSTLIKDQYYLGLSLSRKYKLLRTAYNIFMLGFLLATVVFGVSWLF